MLPRWRHLGTIAGRLMLAAALFAAPYARAADAHYFNSPTFEIPINWGNASPRQGSLFVSTDGQRFQLVKTVRAGVGTFSYTAPGDGRYFFVLQLEDADGRKSPEQVTTDDISLKVIVDRKPPTITLKPTRPQDGHRVAVVWKVEDEHGLDPASIRLEYTPRGRQEWEPVPIKAGMAYAQRGWSPAGAGPFDVRLSARDRAGNAATATTQVTPGAARTTDTAFGGPLGLASRQEHHVKNRRFNLDYKIDKVGPSQIKNVEIWFTRDTKEWRVLRSDAPTAGGPVTITAPAEGLYGFTIRPVNGVGKGPEAPAGGQEPQIWVRVDETRPLVTLKGVSDGSDGATQIISWSATDDHLRDRPITISYSENKQDWKVLKGELDNSGTFTCPTKDLPFQFYVRVEAVDKAGNVGAAETAEMVRVDTSVPEVKGISVSVGGVGVSETKAADTPAPPAPAGAPPLPGG